MAKAGEWESPGLRSSEAGKDSSDEGKYSKPGKKDVGFGKHEGKFPKLGKSSDGNPSSGMIDEWSRPGTGKEGSANKELNQRPQVGESASGQMGAARFGEPMIHENSVESEVYCAASDRVQSLEGLSEEEAEEKRMKFNAGALSIDAEAKNETIISNRNAEIELDRDSLDGSK